MSLGAKGRVCRPQHNTGVGKKKDNKGILSGASRPRTPAPWRVSRGVGEDFSLVFYIILVDLFDSSQNFMVKDIGHFYFYGL